jgi:oligopeptide/dipeptide ABC transporter ATP-binding protein
MTTDQRPENTLLSIRDLRVSFDISGERLEVVRGFSTDIAAGEITGVLGESGSGKTVSFSSLLGLIDQETGRVESGSALFRGRDLLRMSERELREVRGKEISYIFQNAGKAMNPYKSVGHQMVSLGRVHGISLPRERVIETLRSVGLDTAETIMEMYPFELSGGQNQRVMIALGIILDPALLIADEPTSFVDATVRRRILDLLTGINKSRGASIVIMTHDFEVVRRICDRIVIMYGGLIMEEGATSDVLHHPLHPYTAELIACTRSLNSSEPALYSIPGAPISPRAFANECPFAPRCRYVQDSCTRAIPDMAAHGGRSVRCVRAVDEPGVAGPGTGGPWSGGPGPGGSGPDGRGPAAPRPPEGIPHE